MAKSVRSSLCIGFLLLATISYGFASDVSLRFQIRTTSDTIQAIRYQTGTAPEKPWKSVPKFGHPLLLKEFDCETEYLFVQQSELENVWGDLLAYQYDQKENAWSLAYYPTKTLRKFRIMASGDGQQTFRYQYGTEPNKPWQAVDASDSLVIIEEDERAKEFLFVQQSSAEEVWSDTYAYQYDEGKNSWKLASFPPKGYIWFGTKPTSDLVEMFNHQYGSDSPLENVDISGSPLVIAQFDREHEILFIQQTDGGKEWDQPYAYQYDQLIESWTLLPKKQETKQTRNNSLDLKTYSLFSSGASSKSYSYLIGGGVQANISLGKLLGHTALTFSKGPPKNNRVKSQQAFALSVGVGYPLPLSEKIDLIPEIGYGVILHLLEADFDNDGTYNLERYIDQQIRLSLYLTYELNEKYKLFLAPLGVLFFEKDTLGIMYGCQAGLRFSL